MKRIQLDPSKLLGMRVTRGAAVNGYQARTAAGVRNKAKVGMKAGVKLAPR